MAELRAGGLAVATGEFQAVMLVSPVERPVASSAYGFVRFIGGGLAPFAAGLQLYWVTNNILSIGQQAWLYKRYDLHLSDTHPIKT